MQNKLKNRFPHKFSQILVKFMLNLVDGYLASIKINIIIKNYTSVYKILLILV